MIRATSAAFFLLLVVTANAQYFGAGPRLAVAKIGDDGRLLLTAAQMQVTTRQGTVPSTVYEEIQRARTVERNGEQVTETYTEKVPRTVNRSMSFTVMVPVFQTQAVDAARVKAAELSGKTVASADLAKRLRSAATVLQSNGQPLPEYYKLVFRPETLVLTVPPQDVRMPGLPPTQGAAAVPQPIAESPSAAAEPTGPPPDVVFISFGADGNFDVRQFTESTFLKRMRQGDGAEAKAIEVPVTTRVSIITHYPADSMAVSTAEGKAVEVAALRRSLTKEGAAVASSDGKPVDPLWLTALKPSTLVIDGPEQDTGPSAMPGPAATPIPAGDTAPQPVWPAAPQPNGDANASSAPESTADERAVVEATNAERKKAGLNPLKPDPALAKAARAHAAAMAKANELNHTLAGKGMEDRLTAVGFEFRRAGENIAQGARTPAEAVSDWMLSPGHRANILTADFERIGVGTAKSAAGERFWCQVFATPWGSSAAPAGSPVVTQ